MAICRRACGARMAAALGMLLVTGCSHTVVPPSEAAEPTAVFLLDHGRTSSLVIPHDGALARYSYGEWRWYALGEKGTGRALDALLGDTQAALGRRVLQARPTLAGVRTAIKVPIEAAWRIEVPGAEARALDAELSALMRAGSPVDNPRVGLRFVPHPEPYSFGHNSNHVTAAWLRQLQCRVDVSGPLSRWRVRNRHPEGDAVEP